MQDTGHFNPNFLGGQFRWWVGQVAPAKHWKGNSTKQLEKKAKQEQKQAAKQAKQAAKQAKQAAKQAAKKQPAEVTQRIIRMESQA